MYITIDLYHLRNMSDRCIGFEAKANVVVPTTDEYDYEGARVLQRKLQEVLDEYLPKCLKADNQ